MNHFFSVFVPPGRRSASPERRGRTTSPLVAPIISHRQANVNVPGRFFAKFFVNSQRIFSPSSGMRMVFPGMSGTGTNVAASAVRARQSRSYSRRASQLLGRETRADGSSVNSSRSTASMCACESLGMWMVCSIARTARVRTASGSARSASQRHAIVPALAVCSAASAKQSRNASSCRRSCAVRRAVSASAGFSAFSSGKTLCRSRLRTQSSAAFVESSTCGRRCASR